MISDSPLLCGIAVAGRQSFFDSDKERHDALGDGKFAQLVLHEFTESQIREFFESVGFTSEIPAWLPARPLLLSTIFWLYTRQKSGEQAASIPSLPTEPSLGWSMLLDAISEREAKIEAGVSGSTIRTLLEILATKARASSSSLGPLTTQQITESFTAIAGTPPSSEALSVLQRLPGLGAVPMSDDGQRCFMDEDLVDALGAKEVSQLLLDPFAVPDSADIYRVKRTLGTVGTGVLNNYLSEHGLDRKRVVQSLMELERRSKLTGAAVDLLLFSQAQGFAEGLSISVKDIDICEFVVRGDTDSSNITFNDCIFRRLAIEGFLKREALPMFGDCLIDYLEGFLSPEDLPGSHFDRCEIYHFVDQAHSNTAVLRSDMPTPVRVLLTILRKLFVQSLSGRQAAALRRGLDLHEQSHVDGVLRTLFHEGMATQYKANNGLVVLPVRRMRQRALAVIASPLGCNDPIVVQVQEK